MLSQQQNPLTVLQSLQQQMGSEETNTEADFKPFSIRQYVFASRHRSILQCWPFPEKYLQMCLNRGLRDVLPPFGRQSSLAHESLKDCSYLMHSQDDNNKDAGFCKAEVLHDLNIEHPQNIKNECDLFSDGERCKVIDRSHDCPSSHEEGNHHSCSVSVSLSQPADTCTHPSSIHVHKRSPTLTSPKAMKDRRRKRRGRCKKRSMVDILAVARHCTLEEIYRMNKFCYTEIGIEGCQQMVPFENISISDQQTGDQDSCRKDGSEDHEVANIEMTDVTGNRTLLLKFKLNGCKSELLNSN